MTALSTLVDALKRELAVPGTFEDVFPDTTDTNLLGSLADAFAEAQLMGWFSTMELTVTAESLPETPAEVTVTPDLSLSGGALLVIMASMRTLRSQLRNLASRERYKAGPVEYETERAASVLRAELDYLASRMKDLIANAEGQARAGVGLASVFDNYIARGGCDSLGGLYAYEYRG